ncbi:MAG: AAA family ATPase [Clostridium sp.]|uniref:AAA family ATPase n=1 Tax=Clostridium sp. TaxID=1506 RepID=UPI0039ED6645
MHMEKLYIKDFGIYSNANLENISPGIVVLGGKNRAGKSTLLKLLRHFPYGFSKSLNLPDCRVEYEMEAQLTHNSEQYNARVKGFSEPLITTSNKKRLYKNLYGKIDSFTYKEIFTISLDELQNTDKKDEKIQALLLGAGLKDIIKIPKLIIEIKKEAEKIGGKNGNPKIKLFKTNYSTISEGLAIKEKAALQVDEFKACKDRLKAIEEKIEKEENIKIDTEDNIFILEILKNNYEIYRQIDSIAAQLEIRENKLRYESFKDKDLSLEALNNIKAEYLEIAEDYNKSKIKFLQNTDDFHKQERDFDLYGSNIRNMQLTISGLEEKIKNYKLACQECKNTKREINKDIVDVNQHWKDNFAYILKMNTEEISFVELCENIDKLKKVKVDIEAINLKIKELQQEKNIIAPLKVKVQSMKINSSFVVYSLVSLAFIILGIVIYRFSKSFGVIASLAGIAGALYYSFLNSRYSAAERVSMRDEEIKLKAIDNEIYKKNEALESLHKSKSQLDYIIEEYKVKLFIDRQVPLDSIKDYFRIVRDIKKRVMDLEYNLSNIETMEKDIYSNLNKMLKAIVVFQDILNLPKENIERDILNNSEYIFEAVKKLSTSMKLYEDFKVINNVKCEIENRIIKKLKLEVADNRDIDLLKEIDKNIGYFNIYNKYSENRERYINLKHQLLHSLKLDRVKKLLVDNNDNINDVDIFNAFKERIKNYVNIDEIDRQINELKYRLKGGRKGLEALRDEKLNIKEKIKRLYNSEDTFAAQKKIESGRRELKSKAEEYAVYNAAVFILDKIQKSFIDNAKGTILGSAGDILSSITEGEFVSVLPAEELTKYDFKSYNQDGSLNESTDILSRGTKEQLFLSVRLSRIKDIKDKLPVVIDDSLVNFDYRHLKNVVKVLKELSMENQIFILTCHSELVKLIEEEDKNAQFFKIEKGNFSEIKGEELSDYLL